MVYRSILLLFLVSGAFGLGYQVLWSKYLLDFIGVSAYSYATVLAAFMGGLALGSAWLGRVADRVKSPLRFYAILEAGVGLYAIAYLPIMEWTKELYGSWVRFAPDEAGATFGIWAKLTVSGLLLLPPTILLGGTFPAMVRHVTVNMGVVGRRASRLYSLNALGAVVGTLAMAFLAMPMLGMRGSLWVLAAGNLVVAAAAWLLARARVEAEPEPSAAPASVSPAPEDASPSTRTAAGTEERVTPAITRLVLIVIALEGMISFGYEIAWTRYFGLVLGSSTYSFAVMLAAFITGIALGAGLFASFEHRIRRPLAFFGATQIAAGLLVVLPLFVYPYVPWVFSRYASLFSGQGGAFFLFEMGKLVLCFVFMLPPTTLIGMAIPIVVKGLANQLGHLGRDSGRIYAWNTLGSVVGSLLAGLVLLPLLGMEELLRIYAIGNAGLGLLVILAIRKGGLRAHGGAVAACVATLLIAGVAWVGGGWDNTWFSLSRFRRDASGLTFAEAKARLEPFDVVLFEDDPAANLMVTSRPTATGPFYTLYVNGKPDASSDTDLPTQLLSGHIPLLLHPDPKDVLIIGMASGVTAGASLEYPIERLDVVELVRKMPKATRVFGPWNGSPEYDPRCVMIFDDARSYLSYTTQVYDLIVSEPSNPWMAGIGALFTEEFYNRAKRSLRDDGIYLQWIQLYDMSDQTLGTVIRSFRTAFPYIYGFQGNNVDLLLLGSRKPLQPDSERIERLVAEADIRRQLESVNIRDTSSLLFLQRFGPRTAEFLASFAERVNTDDNHFLEYRAPRDLFAGKIPVMPFSIDARLFGGASLLWREWRDATDPDLDVDVLLRALADNRMRLPRLVDAFKRAAWEMEDVDVASLEGDEWDIFRDPLAASVPLDVDAFESRVDALLPVIEPAGLLELVDAYRHPMLVQVAFWESAAERALAMTERWLGDGSIRPALRAILLELRIDQLLAAGRVEEAARRILEAAEDPEGAPTGRLLERACRLGIEAPLGPIVEALARRGPNPLVERFRLLAVDGGEPAGGEAAVEAPR